VFTAIVIVPMIASVIYALMYTLGLAGLMSRGFTLEHWRAVLFGRDLWYSLAFSVGTAFVSIATGSAIALLILRNGVARLNRGVMRSSLLVPLAFPGMVAAFVMLLLLADSGLIARVAFHAGLIASPVQFVSLVHDRANFGVVAAHVLMATPLLTFVFYEIFKSERIEELLAVGRSLGGEEGPLWRLVAIPAILRRAIPTLILLVVVVTGSYEIPLLLGRQSPQMLSVLTMRKFGRFDILQKPQAFVIAVIYTILAVAVIAVSARKLAGKSTQ